VHFNGHSNKQIIIGIKLRKNNPKTDKQIKYNLLYFRSINFKKKLMLFRNTILAVFLFCGVISVIPAQMSYNPLLPPDTYRNADNPHYWKNRKPFEGYWQQDVHYTIKANIDETTDIISGSEKLVYYNNSPDELNFVFFHLYQNAFQPGSYYDNLQKNNGVIPKYGKYES
jgi:hypothetical protein